MRFRNPGAATRVAIALGTAGATILAARQVIPTVQTLAIGRGPIVEPPATKPNAYVDADGRSLVSLTMHADRAEGVRRAIDLLGGLGPLDLAGRSVLIVPSASTNLPPPASTSPAALEAMIELAWDAGARDVIVGAMSVSPVQNTQANLMANGLLDAADRAGARFVDFRYDRWVQVPLGGRSRRYETLSIPLTVYEAERLIGIPALTTDRVAGFSLSLKLWMSAIHPRQRVRARTTRDVGRAVAECNLPFRPDLLVLDGGRARVAGGPDRGETARTDLFLASGDRVALDASGVALLAGHRRWPAVTETAVWDQPQIRAAIDLGLGATGPSRVALVEDPAAADAADYQTAREQIDGWAGVPAVRGEV